MNLIEFNPENCYSKGKKSIPAINVYFKNAQLIFSTSAAELVGIEENTNIKFFQDPNNKEDWYMEVVKEGGFPAMKKTSNIKHVQFSITNRTLVEKMINSLDDFTPKEKSGRILLAGKPTEFDNRKLWGLIVTTLRNN